MQELDAARISLHRALQVGREKEIKSMALADPDLESLWEEICRL